MTLYRERRHGGGDASGEHTAERSASGDGASGGGATDEAQGGRSEGAAGAIGEPEESEKVLVMIQNRKENPEEMLPLYKGGSLARLRALLTNNDADQARSPAELQTGRQSDFTTQTRGLYFVTDIRLAQYYARMAKRIGPANEEFGVLTAYPARETLEAMEVEGDDWKEVSLTDNSYCVISCMLTNVNATTVCVHQQDLLGHAQEVEVF